MASVSIKRGTKQVIDNTSLKDGRLYFTTDQPINKIYTDIPNGQGGLERITIGGGTEVDSELSTTSTNPVQNKVITNEVDDVRGQIHTNLIDPSLFEIATSSTQHGITITHNGDGTFTVNGTTDNVVGTDGKIAVNILPWASNIVIADGVSQVKLCGTPSNINGKALIQLADANDTTAWYSENGAGTTINTKDGKITAFAFRFEFYPNTTFNNVVFKPMLTTDLSADYDSFVKYSGGEERLNEQVASLHESSKGLITNLLNSTLGTTTVNGVTCTANGDGTYTLNGTATVDHTRFYFENRTLIGERLEKGKTYKLLDGLKNTSMSTYNIHIALYNGTTYANYAYPTTNGEVVFTLPTNVVYDRYFIYLNIRNGQTLNNVTFKPMLTTDLDATYNDYVPYSGDGRLNENVAEIYDKVEKNTEDIATHTDEISQINADLSEFSISVLKGNNVCTTSHSLDTGNTEIDKSGHVVTLTVAITLNSALASYGTIATLKTCKPCRNIYLPNLWSGATLFIDINGEIRTFNPINSGVSIQFTISYITND